MTTTTAAFYNPFDWKQVEVNQLSGENAGFSSSTNTYEQRRLQSQEQSERRFRSIATGAEDSDSDCKAPAFIRSLHDRTVPFGGQQILEVVVTGFPCPSVCWYKDGQRVEEQNIERSGNTYRVYIVDAISSDGGVYSVQAVNEYGEAKCYARLFIGVGDEDWNRISTNQPNDQCGSAPRFTHHFSDTFATTGDNVILSATIVGSPKPTVQWMLNSVPIHNSRYHYSTVENTYTLVVSNCNSQEDCGKFSIEAENKHGKASCSARLYVTDSSDYTNRKFLVDNRSNRQNHSGRHTCSGTDFLEERYSRANNSKVNVIGLHSGDVQQRHKQRNRPITLRSRSDDATRTSCRRHQKRNEHHQVLRNALQMLSSDDRDDDDYLSESTAATQEVKRIHEFTRNVTERSYRVPVMDQLDDDSLQIKNEYYKPVELIVGKPRAKHDTKTRRSQRRKQHRSHGRSVERFNERRREVDHRYSDQHSTSYRQQQARKRQIRLSSVPAGEHYRKVLTDDERHYCRYRPIDLIVNKPKFKRTLEERSDDSLIQTRKRTVQENGQSLEISVPKSTHCSTVIKQPRQQDEYCELRVDGEHEKRFLTESIGMESEVELKIPKPRHSTQIYKQPKPQQSTVLNVTEPTIIAGEESIRFYEKPLQVDEEIQLRVQKQGGQHSSTIVRNSEPEVYKVDFPKTAKIAGSHDLKIVDESVEAQEETEVMIPKPRTIHGDHMSTVMREQQGKIEQTLNLPIKEVIPGEFEEKLYDKTISSEHAVDIKLPKQESRHTSTIVQNAAPDHLHYDVNMVCAIPGHQESKTVTVQADSTELILPKSKSQHSSTVIREKGEKVSLGKTRSFSGDHLYKVVDDTKTDYSSTVMLDGTQSVGKLGKYDINLVSEISELDEDLDDVLLARQGHVVSWISDVSERRPYLQSHLIEATGRHLTTVIKNQDTTEEIEMLLPRAVDTSEIVTKVNEYTDAESIYLQPDRFHEQRTDDLAQSQLSADVECERFEIIQGIAPEQLHETSISIDATSKQREKVVDVQMSSSSAELVAELKSQWEIKSSQISPQDNQSTVLLDLATPKAFAPVEVNVPAPTVESSKSVLYADVKAAYEGPKDALLIQEQSSSQLVMRPHQKGTYELNMNRPVLEGSSSTVIAGVKANLTAHGKITEHVQVEPSSSTFNIDLSKKSSKLADVQLTLPEVRVQDSRSEVMARVDSTLVSRDDVARSTVLPHSTCSISIPGESIDKPSRSIDVCVKNVKMEDSKSEIVAKLPGKAHSQLIGGHVCDSSASIVLDTGLKPMEITMNIPDQQPSSSTLMTHTRRHGLSTAEIKNFGASKSEGVSSDQFDIVIHQPRHSYRHEALQDKSHWETSGGSSTVIKEIGFCGDDDSTDRYFLSDGEQSSSTMQVDIGSTRLGPTTVAATSDYDSRSSIPRFVTELCDVSVDEGERLVLSCQVIGAQRVEWYKDGIHPGSHCQQDFINSRFARLTISEVFEDDSGLYTCIAISPTNSRNQTSSFVNIRLQVMTTSYNQERVRQFLHNHNHLTTPMQTSQIKSMMESVESKAFENSRDVKTTDKTANLFVSNTGGVTGFDRFDSTQSSTSFIGDGRETTQTIESSTTQIVDPFAKFGARRSSANRKASIGDKLRAAVEGTQHDKRDQIPLVFIKQLPNSLVKQEGNFVKLEVLVSDGQPGDIVEWKLNGQKLDEQKDLRISSSKDTHSLVIPRVAASSHSGTYSVKIKRKVNQQIESFCQLTIKGSQSRFDQANETYEASRNTDVSKLNASQKDTLRSTVKAPDLHIRASKSPKPETRITVREASAENSVFTFSENEDGQFVSV